MNKPLKLLSLAAVFFGIGIFSGNTIAKQRPHPSLVSDIRIKRSAYELAYDGQHKQARWVYEHLTSEQLQGDSDRDKFDFQEDPLIPRLLRSTKKDFLKSGFDRGHLCPAADAGGSDKSVKETFYFSNISPQCPQFNRGYWLKLERHVRTLAKRYGAVHVFTGGLYLPQKEADGKRYVKYQVIGENDVAVPTHFFKIVLRGSGETLEAYILPNEPIASEIPLEKFMTTVEKVERSAGVILELQETF